MTEHAFPMVAHDDPLYGGRIEGQRGMTLRDYFASVALTGLIARYAELGLHPKRSATTAYEVADAMMEARSALEEKE